jgi:ubiquinone/menaquinone biosynthesis C-methylase UbiE
VIVVAQRRSWRSVADEMDEGPKPLSIEDARRVYDRIGRFQDWNRFYEHGALSQLVAHGGFGTARAVYEFGCGTGSLARRLLTTGLPGDARYHAVDISDTMIRLASQRLAPFGSRVTVSRVDGGLPLPGDDGAFDRFVAAYVFDLLAEDLLREVLREAARLLSSSGRLCVASLSTGDTALGRLVGRSWAWLWRRAPRLVGGCRPLDLTSAVGDGWEVTHVEQTRSWGIPSEMVIATTS